MKTIAQITVISLTLACLSTAWAAVPDLIPVQGYLTDKSTGDPIDGLTNMRFDIYSAQTGGTLLWESIYSSSTEQVDVDEGYFVVYLGELGAHPLDFYSLISESQLWLQMAVDGEAMDRIRMASVAFSEQAQYCTQIGDMEAGDIQPSLGPPCQEGHYLRGWDADAGTPICDEDQTDTPSGTFYYNVSGFDIIYEHNANQTINVTNYGEVMRTANSSETNVFAPVHLPDGVTVTAVRAWVFDNNSRDVNPSNDVANVYVPLYRRSVGTSGTSTNNLAYLVTATGEESTDVQVLEDTTISPDYAVIDNENYDYYFWITIGNTSQTFADMSFYKARIEYTY